MTKTFTYPVSRLFWLLFGAGFGVAQIVDGSPGSVVSGVGLILFGAAWFLRPILLIRTTGPILDMMKKAEVGPRLLHSMLTFTGCACLLVGMALKYMLKF